MPTLQVGASLAGAGGVTGYSAPPYPISAALVGAGSLAALGRQVYAASLSAVLVGSAGLSSTIGKGHTISASLVGVGGLSSFVGGPYQVIASLLGACRLTVNIAGIHFIVSDQRSAESATPSWNAGIGGSPLGFQQITLGSNPTPLVVPQRANLAVISCEGSGLSARWRDDGIAPTASVGVVLVAGGTPMTYSASLGSLQFIAVSGSPVLNISYYM